jgi:hypothetical protein
MSIALDNIFSCSTFRAICSHARLATVPSIVCFLFKKTNSISRQWNRCYKHDAEAAKFVRTLFVRKIVRREQQISISQIPFEHSEQIFFWKTPEMFQKSPNIEPYSGILFHLEYIIIHYKIMEGFKSAIVVI